jgi:hypothetical protein
MVMKLPVSVSCLLEMICDACTCLQQTLLESHAPMLAHTQGHRKSGHGQQEQDEEQDQQPGSHGEQPQQPEDADWDK